ncbi:MAG: hypothetical protein KJ721_02450 [Nanoarchaeota archaeon]|nr:hypothetical protein [Nanoarchaeota archaeon]
MKNLKEFDEFLYKGAVEKRTPNEPRARDLIIESDKTFKSVMEIVGKIGVNDTNANTIIKESYDAVMGLIRAKMLLKGFISSGIGAHEAEISYMRELNFSEGDVQFANQLRYFRNGIMYYGKRFDKEYAEKVFEFLKKIRVKLNRDKI